LHSKVKIAWQPYCAVLDGYPNDGRKGQKRVTITKFSVIVVFEGKEVICF